MSIESDATLNPMVPPTPPSTQPPPPPRADHRLADVLSAAPEEEPANPKFVNIEFTFLRPRIITKVVRQPAAKVDIRPKGPKMLVHKCPEPPASPPPPPYIAPPEPAVPEPAPQSLARNQSLISITPIDDDSAARAARLAKDQRAKHMSTSIRSPPPALNQPPRSPVAPPAPAAAPIPTIAERMKSLQAAQEQVPARPPPPQVQLTTSSIKERMAMLRNSGLEKALAGGGVRQVKTVKAQQYSAEELAQKPTFNPMAGSKPSFRPIPRTNASTKEEVATPGQQIRRNVRPNNRRRPPTLNF